MICALFIGLNNENEFAIILLHHGFQMENWQNPYVCVCVYVCVHECVRKLVHTHMITTFYSGK